MKITMILEDNNQPGYCEFKLAVKEGTNFNPPAVEIVECMELLHEDLYNQVMRWAEKNLSEVANKSEAEFLEASLKMKVSDLDSLVNLAPAPVPGEPTAFPDK